MLKKVIQPISWQICSKKFKDVDKEAILKIAKKEGVVKYRNMNIRIFPDFTAESCLKRAQFKDVTLILHENCIRHGIIHPATLIISCEGETKDFQDHKAAELNQQID